MTAIIDTRTLNYHLPCPGPNNLDEDVLRIIEALQTIDATLKSLSDGVAARALSTTLATALAAIKPMPAGDIVGTTDAQRLTGKVLDTKTATLASASTVDIAMADANRITVTGTTTINSFGAASAGVSRTVTFAGALSMSNSANLLLPGAANITTAAGDVAELESVTPGTWRCTAYLRSSAMPVLMSGDQTVAGNKTFTGIAFSDSAFKSYATSTLAVTLYDTAGGQSDYSCFNRSDNSYHWTVNSAEKLLLDASGNLVAAANVTAYSDERLKTEWAGFSADFVQRLAGIQHGTYTRIDDESGMRQAGVSAQSLRALLPETVLEDENGILSVAYGNAALVAAVQLAQRVVDLDARLAELEAR